MDSDESKVDKLPFLEDALLLPKPKFNEIVRTFVQYSQYCDSVFIPEKIQEWCQYLGCVNGMCSYKSDNAIVSTTTLIVTSRSKETIAKHCFDIFFCPPPWSSSINYYCLGILCFMLLIIAFLMNILYAPSFTMFGQRSGTEVLLTALVSTDIFVILISVYLDYIPFVYKTHDLQTLTYSKYVAIFVPYLVPCQSFFQTWNCWILCFLLFERYLYQMHGKHARLLFSFRTTMQTIVTIGIILLLFTIFKFLNMTTKSAPNGYYSVHYSSIGLNDNYHNLITNWLKVPLEYFGPLVALVSFLCLIYTNLGEQGLTIHKSHNSKTSNYNNVKNFVILNENKREDRILISVLLISTMAIVVKFPKFVHHIFVTEEANISYEKLHYVMISYLVLEAAFLFIKPFIYIYITPAYCVGLHQYCVASCPGNQENSVGRSRTFEETITSNMRESISYRNSIWAVKPNNPDQPSDDACQIELKNC